MKKPGEEVVVVKLKKGIGYRYDRLPELKPYLEIGFSIKEEFDVLPREDEDKEYYHRVITLEYK